MKTFTSITVNKVANVILVSFVKTGNKSPLSRIVFLKQDVQQHVIPLQKSFICMTFDAQSLLVH